MEYFFKRAKISYDPEADFLLDDPLSYKHNLYAFALGIAANSGKHQKHAAFLKTRAKCKEFVDDCGKNGLLYIPLEKQNVVTMFMRNKFQTVVGADKPSEDQLKKFVKDLGKQKEMTLILSEAHSILKKPEKGKHGESQVLAQVAAQDTNALEKGLAKLLDAKREGPIPGLRSEQATLIGALH